MEKYLISGNSGFIGSHLVKILEKNHTVIGISAKKNNNQKILQIKKDILRLNQFKFPKNISHIIHLAALTDVEICQKDPVKCFAINIEGTRIMLEVARKHNSKFIFLSTSHVYGNPLRLPIKEQDPTNARSIYAQSKVAGEILCRHYSKNYGLDIGIIRLFSIYGPNSPKHLVTSKIISQMIDNKKIILGNIKPKRDFLFIDDAINAIKLVLEKNSKFNIYNVGTGQSHSIKEIIDILQQISDKKLKIISSKSKRRKNEISNIVADISKIKKLGWKPKVSLAEGLKNTYDWYKSTN